MARKKRRPFTDLERMEVCDLCMKGRLGQLNAQQEIRVVELYAISPDEYGEISRCARMDADATVNPLLKPDGDE